MKQFKLNKLSNDDLLALKKSITEEIDSRIHKLESEVRLSKQLEQKQIPAVQI